MASSDNHTSCHPSGARGGETLKMAVEPVYFLQGSLRESNTEIRAEVEINLGREKL